MATSSLQGKSVIVTGASKGIGKGIARVFARDGGAKVLVVSRHLKEAEAAAKEDQALASWLLQGMRSGLDTGSRPKGQLPLFMA